MMAVEWTLGAWMQPEWRSNAASRRARPEGDREPEGKRPNESEDLAPRTNDLY